MWELINLVESVQDHLKKVKFVCSVQGYVYLEIMLKKKIYKNVYRVNLTV